MTEKKGIEIHRSPVEAGLMTIKSYFTNNRKFVLTLFIVLFLVGASSVAGISILNSKATDNLVEYEKIIEKYRLNSSDIKIQDETISKLKDLIKSSGVGTAIDLCHYDLGNIYFDKEKYAESAKSFSEFIKRTDSEDVYKGLAVNKMAIALEESGKTDEALDVLVKYDSGNNKSIVDDQILFNLGRLHHIKGNNLQGKNTLERLIATYPASTFVKRARERIFLIDSK